MQKTLPRRRGDPGPLDGPTCAGTDTFHLHRAVAILAFVVCDNESLNGIHTPDVPEVVERSQYLLGRSTNASEEAEGAWTAIALNALATMSLF